MFAPLTASIQAMKYTALLCVLAIASTGWSTAVAQQTPVATGLVIGTVIDAVSREPIAGATVSVDSTGKGGWTTAHGMFRVAVPPGVHAVTIRSIGYQSIRMVDIVVKPGRSTVVDVQLTSASTETEAVIVSGDEALHSTDLITSTTLSYEEIRRSAGGAGDVSRVFAGQASVAKVDDTKNALLVRGGNPMENAFYVDNIEIPNINHFPTQSATGGPIGILNVDFIRSAEFSPGPLPSRFGDRLSSVMDIKLRDGSRDQLAAQLDLSFIGYGGQLEGPLFSEHVSFMVSARRSYLDLIVKLVDAGTTSVPNYADYQGKISWSIDRHNDVEFLLILADDASVTDSAVALENKQPSFGDQRIGQLTIGATWHHSWSAGTLATSLSMSQTSFVQTMFDARTTDPLITTDTRERTLTARSVAEVLLGDGLTLGFGTDVKALDNTYNTIFGSMRTGNGDPIAPSTAIGSFTQVRGGTFGSLTWAASDGLDVSLGVRAEWNEDRVIGLSPRVAVGVHLDDASSIAASMALTHQHLPAVLLAQQPSLLRQDQPRCVQGALSYMRSLNDATRLTIDAYVKAYDRFPVDPTRPAVFLVDELFYTNEFVRQSAPLVANGTAMAYGIEVSIQRRLSDDLYGSIAGSVWRTMFKTQTGALLPRAFDNQYSLTVEGGYRISSTIELSARFMLAGGAPYTPFDHEASIAAGYGIQDTRNVHASRLPMYHALNIRADKRFHFDASSMVVYVSIWNAYNRRNVATTYWNPVTNSPDVINQFGILPVFGIEWEV